MGSSYTSFKDHGFWSRDGLLELWLKLLANNLPGGIGANEWLRPVREDWLLQSSGIFNGFVSAHLNELLDQDEKVKTIISVADRVIDTARAGGTTLSKQALEKLGIGDCCDDLPTAFLEEIHEAFTKLLRGELDWDQATSPMLPILSKHQP